MQTGTLVLARTKGIEGIFILLLVDVRATIMVSQNLKSTLA
jgi:hypothetical protein